MTEGTTDIWTPEQDLKTLYGTDLIILRQKPYLIATDMDSIHCKLESVGLNLPTIVG